MAVNQEASGSLVFEPGALQAFVAQIWEAVGTPRDIAEEVARHLVRANLTGHDSHGVWRVLQYMPWVEDGTIVPAARPAVVLQNDATALIDANRGFGHYSTAVALNEAMVRAKNCGVAAVVVRHSTHIGRLGEYSERAAEQGLVSLVTAGCCGPDVGGMMLYGGTKRFFGANPYTIGIPSSGHAPMVFDGSTSMIAEGKVDVARAAGSALPPGCVVDAQGRFTTNPEDFYEGGGLVALGGEVAGHKGYGLAFASALLGGLSLIDAEGTPSLAGGYVKEGADPRGRMAGVLVLAIDPEAFGNRVRYAASVGEALAAAKRVPPASDVDEVLVPGEPEAKMRAVREVEGISLPATTWQKLLDVAKRHSVTPPVVREVSRS